MASDLLAVLFDLDGVIVDSREHHMLAWLAWGHEHAPEAPERYFLEQFGKRNDAIIGGIMPEIAPGTLQRLAYAKEELFRACARGHLEPLPGVMSLLEYLDELGVPKAIVTSTPRANLDMVLETLGIAYRFDTLVAEEDARHGKPDPEGFLVAASRLETAPNRCVVIEDAPAGLQAAKSGGMRAIGVTTTRPAEDLHQADLVVDSLAAEAVRAFLTLA